MASSKSNNLNALSKVTGMKREELLKLWEEVKCNQKKLDNCSKHEFKPLENRSRMYKCINCGGEAGFTSVSWYKLGLKHGMSG